MRYRVATVLLGLIVLSSTVALARIDGRDFSDSRDRLLGDTTCPWGETNCNACVNNVEENFKNISDNSKSHTQLRIEASDDTGELMSLFTTKHELDEAWHIQGMARLPNVGDNNWFVFTRSVYYDTGAIFAGQLTDAPSAGGHLGSLTTEDDAARQITVYETLENATPVSTLNHLGGVQSLGSYVVSAAYCHDTQSVCLEEDSMVYVYDFSDPNHVAVVTSINLSADGLDSGASAAMTKLYNGHYLIIASGYGSNEQYFYISDSDTLSEATTWELRETWSTSELKETKTGELGWGDYQNLNLVTECDSEKLYLVASNRGDDYTSPTDWLGLFLVEEDSDSNVKISKVDRKTMACVWCNFAASGNIYITPERNMVLYSSHKDDDDGGGGSGDIQFEEFQNALNVCNSADDSTCDYDEDGLTTAEEESYGTSAYKSDTDGDGLSDEAEINTYGTSPTSADSDADGVSDGDEVSSSTDPIRDESFDAILPIITYLLSGDPVPVTASSEDKSVAEILPVLTYLLSGDVAEATDASDTSTPVDADGDGYTTDNDCNDSDARIHPDRRDCGEVVILRFHKKTIRKTVADSVDQDCDGAMDEDRCKIRDFFKP